MDPAPSIILFSTSAIVGLGDGVGSRAAGPRTMGCTGVAGGTGVAAGTGVDKAGAVLVLDADIPDRTSCLGGGSREVAGRPLK